LILILTLQIIFKGEEKFLSNVKQLTFSGENAEAYFSKDERYITFQSKGEGGIYLIIEKNYLNKLQMNLNEMKAYDFVLKNLGNNKLMIFIKGIYDTFGILKDIKYEKIFIKNYYECDQIFLMDTNGFVFKQISKGGANTCSWFLNDSLILFSSTIKQGKECPKNLYADEYIKRGIYVWKLFNYDLFVYNLKNDSTYELYSSDYYDAEGEGNFSDSIVFTSSKDNDLELYLLSLKNKKIIKRITKFLSYDGGAMFSPSGRYIVFRAKHLKDTLEIKEYKELLSKGLVKPDEVELFIYDLEKDSFWQITKSPKGVSNFAPYFHPSEKFIIFSSNLHAPNSFNFELYKIDIDGKNLERITYSNGFNSFPMFSKDGKKIIWTSNRNGKTRRDFNIFIADFK
jgi:TolB protein